MDELGELLDKTSESPRPNNTQQDKYKSPLNIFCANTNARNIALFVAIYTSFSIAGGIPIPVFGAYWFGDCIRNDGRTMIENKNICKPDYRKYNMYSTIFWSIGGLMSFVFAGFLGRISDSFGRKPMFLLCILSYLIPRATIIFYSNIFVYMALSVLNDVPSACFATTMSDIFQDSPPKMKPIAYAFLSGMAGVGLLCGALIVLIVSFFYDNMTVFTVLCIGYVTLTIFCVLFIREPLSISNTRAFDISLHCNPFRSLLHIFDNRVILFCSMIGFIEQFDNITVLSIILSFAGNEFNLRGEFETNFIFALLSVTGGCGAIIGGTLVMPFMKKCNASDLKILVCAICLRICGLFLLSLSPQFSMISIAIIGTTVLGIGSMGRPANTSIASSHLFENEQGIGLGIINSYRGFAAIISPGLMGYVYHISPNEYPYIVWYCVIVLRFIQLCIVLVPFKRLLFEKTQMKKQYISTFDIDSYSKQKTIEMEG